MKETLAGVVYTDAVISQLGVGCLEFKIIRKEGRDIQEINVYTQLGRNASNGWGTQIFSGSLPELIEFITKANTAISMIAQIGAMVRERVE